MRLIAQERQEVFVNRGGTAISNLYDIGQRTDGTGTMLAAYRGKVLLLVNVASRGGLKAQYEGPEQLFQDRRAHPRPSALARFATTAIAPDS